MNSNLPFFVRVYFEDTDAGGVVYHSNYLKFAERARTELLRSLGVNQADMMREHEAMFVVRSCYLNCLAPAHLDDVLEVKTFFKKLGHAKLEISQAILHKDKLIATLDLVLAFVSLKGKPKKIDEHLRHLLLTHISTLER